MLSADPISDSWRGHLVIALYGVVRRWHRLVNNIGHARVRSCLAVITRKITQGLSQATEPLHTDQLRTRAGRAASTFCAIEPPRLFPVHHLTGASAESGASNRSAVSTCTAFGASKLYSSQRLRIRSTRLTRPNNSTHHGDDSASDLTRRYNALTSSQAIFVLAP